jgi:3-dehydroquinate synthase
MESFNIHTASHDSKILLGESIRNFTEYLPKGKVFIISDSRVMTHYGNLFKDFPVIIIGEGESNKTFQTLELIFDRLINEGCDRSSFLLGVGGGIVCDVTGFAASIYMRGIQFGFISTTLLSQVDASVGGKNGVNFQGYKNIAGVFNQPEFVLCDPFVLKTLNRREFIGGFSEIIKAAAIKDAPLFSRLEQDLDKALNHKEDVLEEFIRAAVRIKAKVVQEDEREKGERRKLNFGHTFGHALEKLTGIPHGEAVSIGMVLAATLSVKLDLLKSADLIRLIDLLERAGLPTRSPMPPIELAEVMTRDKKKEAGLLHLVLLESIGNAVNYALPVTKLEDLLNDLR